MGLRPHVHAPRVALLVALPCIAALVLAGCGSKGDDSKSKSSSKRATTTAEAKAEEGRGDVIPDEDSGPTDDYESASDPVNDAFTVQVPVDWTNTVYSTGQFAENRQVVVSTSPDEQTTIFVGDPKLPAYWDPAQANPITVQFTDALDLMDLQAYTPAREYVPQYVRDKFGELPAFELGEVKVNDELIAKGKARFAEAGVPAQDIDSVNVYFTYGEGDDARDAVLSGTTVNGGPFWNVMVGGISTAGDVADYEPMLTEISRSLKINPEYTAKANANHDRIMGEIQANTETMTARHEANMQWIQNSAQAHQQRMQGLWAQADAGMEAYEERMASMDSTQRDFLNYINEEETVANPSGQRFQVDSGYDRYWRNTSDGTYVGGDVDFGDSQLRALGLNPSDYEEVTKVK